MTSSVQISQITGRAIPVGGNDIDTDRIIPARYLRCVTFDGLGEHAFEDDRRQLTAQGKRHSWDDPRFAGAKVLVVNGNFGCGSSREHAPQALSKWGITAIVGVSFSEIFNGNCVAMGLPCVRVSVVDSEAIQSAVANDPALLLTVDLEALEVRGGSRMWKAGMGAGNRQQFLSGQWDATAQLVAGLEQVRATAKRLPYTSSFA
jgi:3-isopropylmalate/(R)-2-methylmalate dehydratase small subunit